jgi:hypothetical protein
VLQKLVTSVGTNLGKGPYSVSGCEIWQQVVLKLSCYLDPNKKGAVHGEADQNKVMMTMTCYNGTDHRPYEILLVLEPHDKIELIVESHL